MNAISPLLSAIHPSLASMHGGPLFVFLIVLLLTLVFVVGYAYKGWQVWRQLKSTLSAVRAHHSKDVSPDPAEVGKAFQWEPLKHLWDEYADTLHELRKAGSGAMAITEVRATVPAEAYFTREVLVDGRLFDDFTRHLPGVLTGLGIIGTFAGLLDGLQQFNPGKIEEAVKGLDPLLRGVQHAFLASSVAIGCAMLVVFISRLVLAYFYRLVEHLTHAIDRLYATGAGEEYLARLVKSSEQSAASTAQLKDALVEDLNKMMTNLVDRQIAAQEASHQALGQHLGETIASAIAEPMRRVGEAMEVTARGNGDQVNSMLETLLTGFMAKLEDTFGGQMRGINEQMQRSMDSMASVQASLQTLLADIKQTNEHAASQMSGTLEDAMKKAADNQQVLTDQMREFVQEFRNLVTEEQSKSKQAMDEAVTKVLADVAQAMKGMEATRASAANEEAGRNERLTSQTHDLVGGLSSQVETLLHTVTEQVSKTQSNIDALGQVSLRAIDGMNQGALTMGSAAQRFETAGSAVASAFERSGTVVETLSRAATSLQAASSAVQRGFEQYDATRKTVDTQVAALMGLIESAKREAGVSQELVSNIKASAEALRQAEGQSREHLEQVNAALERAFSEFGNALVHQIKNAVAETDRHLSQGTGHLNGVVQELANAVHRMKRA
jgi:predicted PurR-regulated permease PerM